MVWILSMVGLFFVGSTEDALSVAWTNWDSSSIISISFSIRRAPCLIRWWVPRLLEDFMLPGTANTSRLYSPANRAVIKDPLFRAASTTTVPQDRPAIILLRRGKLPGNGAVSGKNSEMTAPCFLIRQYKGRLCLG